MSKRLGAWRFVLVALLFAAWIGWLGYLAATKSKLAVLSRPQFLILKDDVGRVDVVAEIDDLDDPLIVKEVLFTQDRKLIAEGDKVQVRNLQECRRPLHKDESAKDVPRDWKGPGLYIVPLRKVKNNAAQLFEV